MTDRYAALLAAYAARDALALQIAALTLGILLARYVIARFPLLDERWQKVATTVWDTYILLAWIGILIYSTSQSVGQ